MGVQLALEYGHNRTFDNVEGSSHSNSTQTHKFERLTASVRHSNLCNTRLQPSQWQVGLQPLIINTTTLETVCIFHAVFCVLIVS
jgi:hypothetical protein